MAQEITHEVIEALSTEQFKQVKGSVLDDDKARVERENWEVNSNKNNKLSSLHHFILEKLSVVPYIACYNAST